GPLSTKADVKKFTDMLRDCIRLVADAKKAGKTLEQMKSENVIAKYDADGKGFVKPADFIELISKELDGAPPAAQNPVHH
ncbi:MAG TPA: hypothetical protein VKF32_00680, partial [Thermoanaerobaculia bacterium]|nr:hypothetical protein [Thermoanaerobaculia bacterium]